MCYLSLKAGLLRTFPLFSPETSKLESACSLLRIEVFFTWLFTIAECTEKKNLSMKENLINIFAPLFIRESPQSANRAAKRVKISPVFLEIHHQNTLDRDLDEYFHK